MEKLFKSMGGVRSCLLGGLVDLKGLGGMESLKVRRISWSLFSENAVNQASVSGIIAFLDS